MRIQIRDLLVHFEMLDGPALPALGPLSLDIDPGSFVCLVGPSGCGKSTLIRVLAGLLKPSAGEVCLDGRPVLKPPSRVSLMFQDANLMPWRSVRDNIALPLELAGISKGVRYAEVEALLPWLGLSDFANVYPVELSGGMAQRAALGRVLIDNPALLLLDEPFGALDALTREQISLDLLRMWRTGGQTILMVTHDINEAVLLADRVVVMTPRPGKIAADLTVTLPRPRKIEDCYEDDFARIARQVRQAIS